MQTKTIPILRPFIAPEAVSLIEQTLSSGWIGEGSRVVEFERMVSALIGNTNFLALNSCTSAMSLSLHLAGIKEGEEVITTPMTCVATNLPIHHTGAKIVWADICRDGTIDPCSIQRHITENTRAIVAVHFGGLPCNMDEILEIARANSLIVIEDAAQALGAEYKGRPIGTHSDFVCFSFQAVKLITTADGGGLSVKSRGLWEKARRLRWYGLDRCDPKRYEKDLPFAGFKITMNDVLASLGIANMKHIDTLLSRRQEIASAYSTELAGIPGLELCQPYDPQRRSSHWLFPVLAEDKTKFTSMLKRAGIECDPIHRRNDTYSVFRSHTLSDLDMIGYWDEHMTCLPIGHWLTDSDVLHIIRTISAGYA